MIFDVWILLEMVKVPKTIVILSRKKIRKKKNRKNVSVSLSIRTQNVFRNWVKFATSTSGAIHVVCQYSGFSLINLGTIHIYCGAVAPKLI